MFTVWFIWFFFLLHLAAGRLIVIEADKSPAYLVLLLDQKSGYTYGFGSIFTNTVVLTTCGVVGKTERGKGFRLIPRDPEDMRIVLPRLPINQTELARGDKRAQILSIVFHKECSPKPRLTDDYYHNIAIVISQVAIFMSPFPGTPTYDRAPKVPLFSVMESKTRLYLLEQIRTNSSCSFFAYYGKQLIPSYLKELESFMYTGDDIRDVICGLVPGIEYTTPEDVSCRETIVGSFDRRNEVFTLPLDPIWGDCPVVSIGTPLMCHHPGSSPDHRRPYRFIVGVLSTPQFCNKNDNNRKDIIYDNGPIFTWQRLDKHFDFLHIFNPDLIFSGKKYPELALEIYNAQSRLSSDCIAIVTPWTEIAILSTTILFLNML